MTRAAGAHPFCKATPAKRSTLALGRYKGPATARWAEKAAARAEAAGFLGAGHLCVQCGPIIWCTKCGSYSEAKAKGLAARCKGMPKYSSEAEYRGHAGGAWGKLRKLQKGIHPLTGERMEAAKDEDGKPITVTAGASGTYANLPSARQKAREEKIAKESAPKVEEKTRRGSNGERGCGVIEERRKERWKGRWREGVRGRGRVLVGV